MKKIISLFAAFIILLSVVSCTNTANVPADTTPAVTDAPATTEVPATTEDPNKIPAYIPTDKYDGHEFIVLMTNWWDQNMNRDLTVNDHLYFTTGDISLVATCAMYNMVFNKEMFIENNWEMPYELVRQGAWTFDKMKEYILQVSEDLDGNEIMDAKDRYGLVYINSGIVGALGASGERMGRVDESGNVVLGLGTEKAQQAIVTYLELISDKDHTFNGHTSGVNSFDMFIDGHCLFRWSEHIAFPHFRDTELDYGILPLPKLDENQERYYTPFGG